MNPVLFGFSFGLLFGVLIGVLSGVIMTLSIKFKNK